MNHCSHLVPFRRSVGLVTNRTSTSTYVARIIPARNTPPPDLAALETTMQSLVLDQSVLALELARLPTSEMSSSQVLAETQQAQGVHFLLRASSDHALDAAIHQLQAHYPQAHIQRLAPDEDPLSLREEERVHVVELRAGGAAYEALRSWSPRGRAEPGADPLLGLLTLLSTGVARSAHLRMVTQLTLLPIAPTWSLRYRRLAVEHPLEEERDQRRRDLLRLQRGIPGWEQILLLGLLVLCLVAWDRLHLERLLPAWLLQAGQDVLHGTPPALTSLQQVLLVGGLLLSMALILVLMRGAMALGLALKGGTSYYDMRRIADKINKSAYRARLRLYIIEEEPASAHVALTPRQTHKRGPARSMQQAHRIRHMQAALVAAYRQFQTATAYFVPRRLPSWLARHLVRRGWRSRSPLSLVGISDLLGRISGKGAPCFFLSGGEVATLWHLPPGEDLAEAAGVEQRQERSLLVPQMLTREPGWQLGRSIHAGTSLPVRFPLEELFKHKFVLGRTGKGKSTLFEHLVLAYLHTSPFFHPGLCVIEPHGDLIQDLLSLLPAERTEDVVLIDLAHDQGRPIGLNPLDATQITSAEEADLIVSHLVTTFKGIWVGAWGPRVENVMRFSLKALIEANRTIIHADPHQGPAQQYTLLDLVVLLTKQSFRHRLLDQVQDPHVLDWWHQFYERLDVKLQDEITTPVLTKISAYASSPSARRLLGQPTSTIDFARVVEQQHIVLVNTASGQVGQDVSSLLGASLLGLFTAALSRQLSRPAVERHPFLVCVDEFRNYPINYAYVLSELRKANTALVLASQSLAQLDAMDPLLRPTVFANADQLFVFTLAGEDAYLLRHELGHALTPEDIITLPDYTCYARWSLRRQRLPFFSLALDLPPVGMPEQAQRVREQCALRYGLPVAQVDAMLQALMARHGSRSRVSTGAGLTVSSMSFDLGNSEEEDHARGNGAAKAGEENEALPQQEQSASERATQEEEQRMPEHAKPKRVRIRRRASTAGANAHASSSGSQEGHEEEGREPPEPPELPASRSESNRHAVSTQPTRGIPPTIATTENL